VTLGTLLSSCFVLIILRVPYFELSLITQAAMMDLNMLQQSLSKIVLVIGTDVLLPPFFRCRLDEEGLSEALPYT
jgi:hypothetical protein